MMSHATTHQPIFPLEVFSLIIDEILSCSPSGHELTTLGNVCRAFASMRRRHLFREVTLDTVTILDSPVDSETGRLMSLMASNPEIATFVRHLVLIRPMAEYRPPVTVEASGFDYPSLALSKPSNATPGPGVSTNFTNISTLSISLLQNPMYSTFREVYIHESSEFSLRTFQYRAVLEHFVAKGCLVSLTLEHIEGLAILPILAQPNLRHLKLISCTTWGKVTPSLALHASGFKLTTLEIADTISVDLVANLLYCKNLEHLTISSKLRSKTLENTGLLAVYNLPSPNFANLRSIRAGMWADWRPFLRVAQYGERRTPLTLFPNVTTVYCALKGAESRDPITVGSLFDHVPNMEFLTIEVGPWTLQRSAFFDELQRCFIKFRSSLRTFHLRYQGRHFSLPLLEALCNALSAIRRTNVLEALVCNFRLWRPHADADWPWNSGPLVEGWDRFDRVLTEDRGDFPALRYVEISVTATGHRRMWLTMPPTFRRAGILISDYEKCQVEGNKGPSLHVMDTQLNRLRGMSDDGDIEMCCVVGVI